MKFILLLALVGCAVNVQVTAAAAINTFYGTDDADERYAAANAAPPSINADDAANLAAAAPYPAAASPNAADAVAKISPSDYAARRRRPRLGGLGPWLDSADLPLLTFFPSKSAFVGSPLLNGWFVARKDVPLPVQLQRAMAAEAEATREARAKVIAAEGEQRTSRALKEAADVMRESPGALQLRYLQTLSAISAEKSSTIIFPLPMELLKTFVSRGASSGQTQNL